jgi:hypothetical protein
MNQHLSADQLIDRVYGLAEEDSGADLHLGSCSLCQGRLRTFEAYRAQSAGDVEMAVRDAIAQRRAILERVEARSRNGVKWAPAVAAGVLAATVLVSLSLWRPFSAPVTQPAPTVAEIGDDAALSEIYGLELADEPRAAVPIRELFEPAEEGN